MPDILFKISVSGGEESAQQIDNVRTALQGVDTELTGATASTQTFGTSQDNLSATQKQVVASTDAASGSTQNLTGAIGGSVEAVETLAPEFATMLEVVAGLTPAQLALAASFGVAGGAALVAAGFVGLYVFQAVQLIETQAQANKAIAAMDFSAIQAGLAKTTDALRALDEAGRAAVNPTGFLGVGFEGIGALTIKFTEFFTNSPAKAAVWAQKMDEAWQTFGRGQAQLQLTKVALEANTAALTNMTATAPSLAALSQAYADQEDNTRKLSQATIDLAKHQADQARAALLDQAKLLEGAGKINEANLVRAVAEEAYAKKREGFAAQEQAADAALIAQKDANAKKIGEYNAKEILDGAKIIDIQNQIAIAAASTGASREQIIEQTSALELKRITDVYNAHKAANAAILASLPYGGVEWQEAYRKGTEFDEQFNLDRLKGAQKTADEWIKLETQRFEEEKKLYAKAKDLDEAKFQLRKVLGEVSAQEEVDRLRKQADAYEANTIERVNAEIKWATAAKKLRVEVSADDGKALEKAREQYGLYADDIIKFGLTAGPAAVAADNDITGALKELIIQGDLATASQDKLGKELADLGVGIVEGLKNVRKDSMTEVEGLITDIGSAIDTGASRLGDKIYQGLIDRLKYAIDAEALAS